MDRDWSPGTSSAGEFFWLDLHRPTADDVALLRELFGLHPLAVEDAEHFGQRPKFEQFDDFVYLVVYGANDRTGRARGGALLLQRRSTW